MNVKINRLPRQLLCVVMLLCACWSSGKVFGQDLKRVTGTVLDAESKVGIPGVGIRIRRSNKVFSTDKDGKFDLQVAGNDVLTITYVGYDAQEITIGNRKSIVVSLKPNSTNLNEVVINVGYGSVKKGDLTGSVGQANMTDMAKAPVPSFDQALAGRIAGVQVSSSDGQPGSEGMNIVIRGSNSLSQSNSPLYVIDGFPVEGPENGALNPDDIASLTVLKDASATAIYGSRGANGVIVIETKKGKTGAAVITYNGSYGFQKVVKTMDMMSGYDFVKYQFELNPTYAATTYGTADDFKDNAGIDWQDQLFRTGATQIHNVAVRGGSAQTKYAISGSVYDQNAIVINSGYNRYQGRISVDHSVNDRFKVGLNANYSMQSSNGQVASEATKNSSATSTLLYATWGYRPVKAGDNSSLLTDVVDDAVDPASDYRINPIISANNEYRRIDTKNLIANGYINYKITNDLSLNITGGINNRIINSGLFYNSLTSRGTPLIPSNTKGSYGSTGYLERNVYNNENTLTYKKSFNKVHNLDIVAGYSQQNIQNKGVGVSAILVPNESLGVYGLANGTSDGNNFTSKSEVKLNSVLGRVNYNFDSKYFFTATFRADGSSKFADGNRWGYFPSAAVAWKISDENFMKQLTFISNAKVRASYGLTGNNRVDDFAYLPVVDMTATSNYSWQNQVPTNGVALTALGNENLKWETTAQTDIGLDLSFFNNRIDFSADVYQKTTKDLLLQADLPPSSGYTSVYKNIGKVQNRGLELSLNTVNINTKNFKWESSFNISFNKSKVLSLNEGQEQILTPVSWETNWNSSTLYVTNIGQPITQFYGYVFDGNYQVGDFNQSDAGVYTLKSGIPYTGTSAATIQPGDIKYKDLNGDGVITTADQKVIGRVLPVHTGGFNNNFTYKSLTLGVLLQWSYGNDIFNANRIIFEGNGKASLNLNQYASYNNRWTPENASNTLYRVGGQGPIGYYSTRTLEDGSFLRVKTVSLSYAIPSRYTKKIGIKALNVTVAGQNLFTFTNYTGIDPEVSTKSTSALIQGFDYSAYPQAKTLVFGVNASF